MPEKIEIMKKAALILIISIFACDQMLYSAGEGLRPPMAFNQSEQKIAEAGKIFAGLKQWDRVMFLSSLTKDMITSGWLKKMVDNGLVFGVNVDGIDLVVPAMKILEKVNKETKYKHGYVGLRIDTKRGLMKVRRTLKELIKLDRLITAKAEQRHNFYIEIPATRVGLEAGMRAMRDHGINIKFGNIATLEDYMACIKAYKQAKQDVSKLKKGPYGVSFAGIVTGSIDPQDFAFMLLREYIYDDIWKRFSNKNDIGLQRISWERGQGITPDDIKDVRFAGTVSNVSPELVNVMVQNTPLWYKTRGFDIDYFPAIYTIRSGI